MLKVKTDKFFPFSVSKWYCCWCHCHRQLDLFFLRVPTTNNTGQNTSLFINPERPRTILGMPDSPVCILFFQSFSSSQHRVSYTKIQSGSFEVPVLHLLCLRMDSFTRKKEKQKKKCQSKFYCSFFFFLFQIENYGLECFTLPYLFLSTSDLS